MGVTFRWSDPIPGGEQVSRCPKCQPSNVAGWTERGVMATLMDAFVADADIRWGDVAVMTEVLEHIADPHGMVERVSRKSR